MCSFGPKGRHICAIPRFMGVNSYFVILKLADGSISRDTSEIYEYTYNHLMVIILRFLFHLTDPMSVCRVFARIRVLSADIYLVELSGM